MMDFSAMNQRKKNMPNKANPLLMNHRFEKKLLIDS